MKFRDRTVLVTGASRGIGRSIALRFAEEGARLALAARTENELLQTATMVEQSGARAVAIPTDIRDRAAVDACVARAEAELGPIDVLVNNAGVFLWRPFLELSSEEWDLVLSTNLTGAANFCRAVLPGMIGRRRGRIVNVSSIHGVRGEANLAAHSAAKFGLIGLTQSLAREYRSFNIAVNAVCPGTVENRQDAIATLIKWLPQPLDVAEHSYDNELRTLSRDGTMTDAEITSIIDRVGEKKRPLDEVRDFSFAREAMKELGR